ncbi:MAG TPA: radical SAM protein [Anaeromyxobacter sp.]
MHSPLGHARSLFLKRPVHLTFFVTRRCNAGCGFCFYAQARDAEGAEPELALDEIRRVAASMGPLLWVLFSGGEPFLREDLVEIGGAFHDANRACFLTYPTNGLLPDLVVERTEQILRRCEGSVVVVKLSLDGVGERHDALRGVPGAFARVMETYRGLSRLAVRYPRLELGVNTVFGPETARHVEELVGFVHGLEGIRAHTLTLLRRPDGGPSPEVDLRAYRRASLLLESRWRSRRQRFHRFAGARLKAAQDRLQRRLIHRTLVERRRVIPCFAGRLGLVLTEAGRLHPCESRWDRSFGNVREAGHDVARLLRSERGRAVVDEIARGSCHCSHECNFLTNILFNPALHPALLRECVRRGRRRAGERDEADRDERERRPTRPWETALQGWR